eukprot:1194669-Prorocentrum_minimum.AAC.3
MAGPGFFVLSSRSAALSSRNLGLGLDCRLPGCRACAGEGAAGSAPLAPFVAGFMLCVWLPFCPLCGRWTMAPLLGLNTFLCPPSPFTWGDCVGQF